MFVKKTPFPKTDQLKTHWTRKTIQKMEDKAQPPEEYLGKVFRETTKRGGINMFSTLGPYIVWRPMLTCYTVNDFIILYIRWFFSRILEFLDLKKCEYDGNKIPADITMYMYKK